MQLSYENKERGGRGRIGRRDIESRAHACAGFERCFDKPCGKKAKLDHGRIGPRIKSISSLSTLAPSIRSNLKIIIVSGTIDIFGARNGDREGG